MQMRYSRQLSELKLENTGYLPGGFSTRICRASGRDGQPLGLYKEYRPDRVQTLRVYDLEALVRWRQDLPTADRKFVDTFCAFPFEVVRDGDGVAGILMKEAPAAFLQRHRKGGFQPRLAEELGRRDGGTDRTPGRYFQPPHKLALLGVFLQRLIWLHDRNIVIADLHPGNILVTASTDYREIYLLDCDSFWLSDLHAFPPHAPEMWRVGGQSQNFATDLAKFARLVVRTTCEDFAIDSVPGELLRRILPGHHIRQLERMWSVDPLLQTVRLSSMARSWTNLIKSVPGRKPEFYIWTDRTGRTRWYPSARRKPATIPSLSSRGTSSAALRITPPHLMPAAPVTPVTSGRSRTVSTVLGIIMVTVVVALIAWFAWAEL